MWFYATAAAEHGRRINISKARGDQSGYLWDAQNVYHNWHGRQPRMLIGERNRMPVYAAYLALFYNPSMSDPEYFEVGRIANIYLSLGLLVILGLVLARHLPALVAINLTGIVTFGWFIYKAGYTQSELLFYTFFFLAFLVCWHMLRAPAGRRLLWLACLGGALAALAHLTKAAVPPFLALFGLAFAGRWIYPPGGIPTSGSRRAPLLWAAGAGLLYAAVFLAIASPYLLTNKRVFGRYFYNVNSTFYVWYDDWPSASVGVRLHGDGHQWPDVPASEMPSAGRYWREHTVRQIAERVGSGAKDMAIVSYRTYDYLGYTVLFLVMLGALAATRWRLFKTMALDHAWLTLFLAAYAAAYLVATAFYFPISGTGTGRFLIAHLLPFFFVLSHVFSRSRLSRVEWRAGAWTIGMRHFHWLVAILLVLDVAFRTWPRLMSTYGGF